MEKLGGIFLSLGSNLGDREQNISAAKKEILNLGAIMQESDLFTSEAWGYNSNNSFLNCCIEIASKLSCSDLLAELKKIEKIIGRTNKSKEGYEDREIDIDIILFRQQILQEETIIVPHPRFKSRNFVLTPLAQIAADVVDPISALTIHQLQINNLDESKIQLLVH